MKMFQVQFKKRTVRAYTLGSSSAPLLVFFQGFGIDPKHYAPLLSTLAQSHHILVFDLLRPGVIQHQPETVAEFAALGAALIEHVEPHRELTLLGHSLGAAVSLTLAAQHTVPKKLILLGPALFPPRNLSQFIARSGLKSARESLGREGLQAVRFAARFHPSFIARTLRHPRRTLRLLDDLSAFDPAQHPLTCPVYIAFFERDEYFTLSAQQHDLLAGVFSTLHIETIPAQNHDGLVFQPEPASSFILRCLDQQ